MVLEPTIQPTTQNIKGGNYGYYRQPNGHITCSEMGGNAIERYMRDGWVPLTSYGTYHLDHVTIHKPLDHLFRMGGAKELPVSQLIEESWCYRDYYVDGVKIEFPQLEGVEIPPLKDCPFCERRGSDAQLANHIEAMHPGQFDLIQRQAAERKLQEPRAAEIAAIVAATPPPASRGDYVCGRCGESFNHQIKLASHIKAHKEDQE